METARASLISHSRPPLATISSSSGNSSTTTITVTSANKPSSTLSSNNSVGFSQNGGNPNTPSFLLETVPSGGGGRERKEAEQLGEMVTLFKGMLSHWPVEQPTTTDRLNVGGPALSSSGGEGGGKRTASLFSFRNSSPSSYKKKVQQKATEQSIIMDEVPDDVLSSLEKVCRGELWGFVGGKRIIDEDP